MNKRLYNSHFRNIYTPQEQNPVICYRFGTTVYEEVFDNGRFVSAGWNASGYTQNVLEAMPMRLSYDLFDEPQAFDLEINGRSLSWDWDYAGFTQSEERDPDNDCALTHGVVTLKSRIMPVTARVHTILDGSSVMTRYLEVVNESDASMNLNVCAPMCGGLEIIRDWDEYVDGTPTADKLYSLGYMENANSQQEGLFRWHALGQETFSFSGKYRRDRFRQPMFMLRNNAQGTFFYAQLGWSGGYEMRFDLNADDNIMNGCSASATTQRIAKMAFKIALTGPNPMLVLDPGETFVSPSVHIACLQGDLDDAVNAMHAHTRKSVFTLPAARGVKGWLEAGIGPERAMTDDAIRHITDTAVYVGAETVIIDAGWYCACGKEGDWWKRVGDWQPDEGKYGKDFSSLREYAHSKGLLFGLWMEPERVGPESKIIGEHPEWVSTHFLDGHPTSLLDLANPDAAAWVESEISRIISEYKMDLFRLDYNISNRDIFMKINRGGVNECGALRYYQNINKMFGNLRRKHPDVVFENCASGGGRTDLGFLSHFTHSWVSDWQIAPRSYSITNGMTMVLPPEMVDRLVGGMAGHTLGSLDFQARYSLFGRPTTNSYNAFGSEFNEDQMGLIKHTFDLYKNFVRPFIEDAMIYHHTPESYGTKPQGTGILERAAADGTRGIIGLFRLADAKEESTVIYPRGLDESKTYDVTFDNRDTTVRVSGHSMVNDGLRVRLSGALSSELILYKAVD